MAKAFITYNNGIVDNTEYDSYESDDEWIYFFKNEKLEAMYSVPRIRSIRFTGVY
jgi:hypothetical protein